MTLLDEFEKIKSQINTKSEEFYKVFECLSKSKNQIKKLRVYKFEDYFRFSEKIDEYLSDFTDEIIEFMPKIKDTQGISFLLYELLINIYKHSKFKNSYIQVINSLDNEKTDIYIIDDGIGIPGSFKEELNYKKNDCEAVFESINGKTTDKEKYNLHGRGLNTSARITTLGFDGEMLVASGQCICIITEKGITLKFNRDRMNGTFIMLRIHNKKIDNLYECIKYEKINKLEVIENDHNQNRS